MLEAATYNKALVCMNPSISMHTDEKQIAQIDSSSPGQQIGKRHNAASFTTFINQITSSLKHMGWDIKEKCFVLSKKGGGRLFGAFTVRDRWTPDFTDFYETVLGFRACYDSTFSRQLQGGDYRYICDNLVLSGQLGEHKTKQTTFIADRQLNMVVGAIGELREFAKDKNVFYNEMVDLTISDGTAHDLFTQVYQKDGLTPRQLALAIDTYHEPSGYGSYNNHPNEEDTAWGAWNAMTHAIKGQNQTTHTARCDILTKTTKDYFGVGVEA